MAANGDELKAVLIEYIDRSPVVEDSLRVLLMSTPVDFRYNLLYRTRGVRYSGSTGVQEAAVRNDEETLKLMLAEFTPTQRYEVIRLLDSNNCTAVHQAARDGHTYIIIQLMSHLSYEQAFNILKVQNSNFRSTALHRAAEPKYLESLQVMLSSVTPQQKNKLLNIKDRDNKTIASYAELPEVHVTSAAWANRDIDTLSEENVKLSQKCEQLEKDREKHTEELGDANQKIATLEIDKIQQQQELADVNQKIAALEIDNVQQQQELGDANQKIAALERDKVQQHQELRDANQRIVALERDKVQQEAELRDANQMIVRLTDRCDVSERDRVQQRIELRDANQKIAALEIDKVQQQQKLRDANRRIVALERDKVQQKAELWNLRENQMQMERMIAELDRVLREPICIGPEMDQVHEHED